MLRKKTDDQRLCVIEMNDFLSMIDAISYVRKHGDSQAALRKYNSIIANVNGSQLGNIKTQFKDQIKHITILES